MFKRSSIGSLAMLVVAVAVIAFLSFTAIDGFVKISKVEKENESIRTQNSDLQMRVAELKDMLDEDEAEIVELYARQLLDYALPGEIIYIDMSRR